VKVVVYSVIDEAGKGIAKELLNLVKYSEAEVPKALKAYVVKDLDTIIACFREDVIYFDFLDEVFSKYDVNYYIVLSRHSAKSGIKSLTVHHTGNLTSSAQAGGRPYELSVSNPPVTKELLLGLVKAREEFGLGDFEVTYEVTHHGPTGIKKPLTFIEIGSSIREWVLSNAHKALAHVVLNVITKERTNYCKAVVGVGGPHYAGTFTKRALTSDECYGHIIPRYSLRELKNNVGRLREIIIKAVTLSSVTTKEFIVLKKVGKVVKDVINEVASDLGVKVTVV